MAITKTTIAGALAGTLCTDNAVSDASGTVANAAQTVIWAVKVDGTETTAANYIKILDATSGAPDSAAAQYVFYAPSAKAIEYIAYESVTLSTGLTYWGTSTPANGSSQAAPTGTLLTRLLF